MAIVNRDLDASQQKELMSAVYPNGTVISTGSTLLVGIVPYPCQIQSARVGTFGVSSTPGCIFQVQRNASGITLLTIGSTSLIVNLGASGLFGHSGVMAAGTTLLQLQTGDVVSVVTTQANTAAIGLVAQLVLKKLQDVVSHNGISS